MFYKIDKDIPPPEPLVRYPFKLMEIGNSFFVPCENTKKIRSLQSIMLNYGKRNGTKYRSRKENNGMRIWRIE
jgi:hypothetical protein